MKKIHTLFLIVAILAFGAIFAGLNFPTSPPTVAETTFTAESAPATSYQTATTPSVSFERDTEYAVEVSYATTGDIPIIVKEMSKSEPRTDERLSASNQTRTVPVLTAANHLKTTKRKHPANKFVSNFAVFRGFGAENQPRGKIWV